MYVIADIISKWVRHQLSLSVSIFSKYNFWSCSYLQCVVKPHINFNRKQSFYKVSLNAKKKVKLVKLSAIVIRILQSQIEGRKFC